MKNKILIIAGPTAVGKTSNSIKLAKKLNGEIVSADSMQIYCGLDIGTAKPTKEEMDGIPHHMIDICHPSEKFSVAQYVKMADDIIQRIISNGKLPIIVGGTGLYIDNLIYNNDFGSFTVDLSIREKLNERVASEGIQSLFNELMVIDPEYGGKLHINDVKRIVHALEIYYSSGKTQTQLIAESRLVPPKYDSLYAVLDCSSRDILYERINKRVDVMLQFGLLEESQWVVDSEWYKNSTASQAIGYKEFEGYFNGDVSLNEAVDLLKQHSRNYAKRQLTWFRHRENTKFYCVDEASDVAESILKDFQCV